MSEMDSFPFIFSAHISKNSIESSVPGDKILKNFDFPSSLSPDLTPN
jgi:hypothetical protein